MPMTPRGTRTCFSWMPPGMVRPSTISPSGSGAVLSSRSAAAQSAMRAGVSASRSIRFSRTESARAASMSRWFAASTSSCRSVSTWAMASRVALRVSSDEVPSVRDASRASSAVSLVVDTAINSLSDQYLRLYGSSGCALATAAPGGRRAPPRCRPSRAAPAQRSRYAFLRRSAGRSS